MTKNGADLLAQTLAENGIDTCFANPGTTEMHLVAAFGRETRMTTHLCVFEGVATGAADGFARMSGRPAVTLLHLGPGLANGMANLHNAKKAATPVVNIVGEHATHHLGLQAPLTADIEGMAATVSESVITATSADTIGADTAELLSGLTGQVPALARSSFQMTSPGKHRNIRPPHAAPAKAVAMTRRWSDLLPEPCRPGPAA